MEDPEEYEEGGWLSSLAPGWFEDFDYEDWLDWFEDLFEGDDDEEPGSF
jgi:hypothetical protein